MTEDNNMEKKQFVEPEMKVIRFNIRDVVATSEGPVIEEGPIMEDSGDPAYEQE